jgi:hypothetical protein
MTTFTSKKSLRKAIEAYFNGKAEGDSNISNWDTSQITNMCDLFIGIKQISVEPITLNWNTSNVTDMGGMFANCTQDFILNYKGTKVPL